MPSTKTDVKSLAIQAVDETIQSALEEGMDLTTAEIVITFTSSEFGIARVKARLLQNIPTQSLDQTIRSDSKIESPLKRNGHPVRTNVELPQWNGRELFVGRRLVKRYRNPGPNQQVVLSSFEEEGWPERIDNPLCSTSTIDAQSRLSDTIKSLNRNHKCCLMRFHGDGTGQGIVWRHVADKSECEG